MSLVDLVIIGVILMIFKSFMFKITRINEWIWTFVIMHRSFPNAEIWKIWRKRIFLLWFLVIEVPFFENMGFILLVVIFMVIVVVLLIPFLQHKLLSRKYSNLPRTSSRSHILSDGTCCGCFYISSSSKINWLLLVVRLMPESFMWVIIIIVLMTVAIILLMPVSPISLINSTKNSQK